MCAASAGVRSRLVSPAGLLTQQLIRDCEVNNRGTPSKTIEQSVTVIGINELRCLLNAHGLAVIASTTFEVVTGLKRGTAFAILATKTA